MPSILTEGPVDILAAPQFSFSTNSHSSQFRTAQTTRPSMINSSEDNNQSSGKDLGTLCVLRNVAPLIVAVDSLYGMTFMGRPTIVYTAKEGPISGTVNYEVRGHLSTDGLYGDPMEGCTTITCATMECVEELQNQALAICHQEVLSEFATPGPYSMYDLDQTQYHLLNRLAAKIVIGCGRWGSRRNIGASNGSCTGFTAIYHQVHSH
jgi:hypothetical protein